MVIKNTKRLLRQISLRRVILGGCLVFVLWIWIANIPLIRLAYGGIVLPFRALQYEFSLSKPLALAVGDAIGYGERSSTYVQRIGIWAVVREAERAELTQFETALALALVRSESSFAPQAKNKESSACGLFQFIEGTGQMHDLSWWECMDPIANARAGAASLVFERQRRPQQADSNLRVRCSFMTHYYGGKNPCDQDPQGMWGKVGARISHDIERLIPVLKDPPYWGWQLARILALGLLFFAVLFGFFAKPLNRIKSTQRRSRKR